MTEKQDNLRIKMVALLYGELPSDEVEQVTAEITADPELAAEFERWQSLTVTIRENSQQFDPAPRVRSAALSAAKEAIKHSKVAPDQERETRSATWMTWIEKLGAAPAFAGFGLVVLAAGLLYTVTQNYTDVPISASEEAFTETIRFEKGRPESTTKTPVAVKAEQTEKSEAKAEDEQPGGADGALFVLGEVLEKDGFDSKVNDALSGAGSDENALIVGGSGLGGLNARGTGSGGGGLSSKSGRSGRGAIGYGKKRSRPRSAPADRPARRAKNAGRAKRKKRAARARAMQHQRLADTPAPEVAMEATAGSPSSATEAAPEPSVQPIPVDDSQGSSISDRSSVKAKAAAKEVGKPSQELVPQVFPAPAAAEPEARLNSLADDEPESEATGASPNERPRRERRGRPAPGNRPEQTVAEVAAAPAPSHGDVDRHSPATRQKLSLNRVRFEGVCTQPLAKNRIRDLEVSLRRCGVPAIKPGTVDLRWTFGADGRIEGLSLANDTIGSVEFTACIRRSLGLPRPTVSLGSSCAVKTTLQVARP